MADSPAALALFGDFSFAAPSPSLADHEAERVLMNCSPTSLPSAPSDTRPPTPPCTIGDLAQLLRGQNLIIDTATARMHTPANGPPTPPSDTESFSEQQQQQQQHAPRPTYCRASASIMRMQRQANARLQCCSTQVRDISRLVRMIQDEEQCSVSESISPSPLAAPASDDEGIDMDYDCALRAAEPLFSRPLYRAGERHNDNARVSKNVRMRKRSSGVREERRKTR